MNDKEKLISLLILTDPNPYTCESESGSCELTTCTECRARSTADLLISHGVTVQECKLGDKIYQADDVRIYESTISEITLTAKHTIFVTENIAFDERAIGNSVFLSYAEAEAQWPKPPKGE